MSCRARHRVVLLVLLVLAGIGGRLPAQVSSRAGQGSVEIQRIASSALGVTKRYVIYLPASYATEPARSYPVVYLLHGLTGNESDWVSRGDLPAMMDSLLAAGMPEMMAIMPDGDNGFWTNWSTTLDAMQCVEDPAFGESPETFCVGRANYGDYVALDLVDHVDRTYRTLADRAHRAVMGVSMGGTGALTLGLGYPRVFGAVVSLSGPVTPLWPTADATGPAHTMAEWEAARGRPLNTPWRARWGVDSSRWWRQDPARAAAHLVQTPEPRPTIRIEVGREDPYLGANRHLRSALGSLGIAVHYGEGPGAHDWRYWRRLTPEVLAWLSARIGA
jgi:enterochelin esterase family protein